MTVAELIADLQKLPQDMIVLLSKDAEGNAFFEVRDCCGTYGFKKEGYVFEIGPKEITEEMLEEGWEPDDAYTDGECVVIWP